MSFKLIAHSAMGKRLMSGKRNQDNISKMKKKKKWENDNNVDLLTTMGTGRATTKIANRPQRQPIACNEK